MTQTIVQGLEQIHNELEGKKFLLVRANAYDYLKIKDFFDEFEHVEFSDFTPNPLYEQVCRGVKLFNQRQCEVIVAVGGGSTIDVAKCINCLLYTSTDVGKIRSRNEFFNKVKEEFGENCIVHTISVVMDNLWI